MLGWQADKKFSDRYLPEIKQILGLHLIGEAPIEEDQQRNTDLIVLKLDAVRVACRIRRPKYFDRYPDEFTIRVSRPKSGVRTELQKIVAGFGDYFFYGFGNDDAEKPKLIQWGLGDLSEFRLWFNVELSRRKGVPPGIVQTNGDGSSDFRAFKWRLLPPAFRVATSFAVDDAA